MTPENEPQSRSTRAGERRVLRASSATRALFDALHNDAHGLGWCQCVAWWVDGFEGWGERTREQNLALREEVFERGIFDGYFLVAGEGGAAVPLAWAQVAPRDRLGRLARVFAREPDERAWALGCLAVVPHLRRHGLARELLGGILRDLPGRGAASLEVFPRETSAGEHGSSAAEAQDEGELWTGPVALYRSFGFVEVARVPPRVVLELRFGATTRAGSRESGA